MTRYGDGARFYEVRRGGRPVYRAGRPGGRIAMVDMALPTGAWRVLWPLARLACFTGGADSYRAPWNRLLTSTDETVHEVITGGHVHIAAGTRAALRSSREAGTS